MTTIQIRTQRERFRISGFGSGTNPDEVEAAAEAEARDKLGGFTGKLEPNGSYMMSAVSDTQRSVGDGLKGSPSVLAAAEAGHTLYATIYFTAFASDLVTEVRLS